MAQLPFPVSGGVFEAFVERARFSPKARIDVDWLVNCLGISQKNNARRTLRWLEAAGIVNKDTSHLTPRGRALLGLPNGALYRRAALDALAELTPNGLFKELRSGNMTEDSLRKHLTSQLKVVPSTANRAIVGYRVLAEASGDRGLMESLGRPKYEKHEPKIQAVAGSKAKKTILTRFDLFTDGTGGIDGWLHEKTPPETFQRLMTIGLKPLSLAQLNQLLTYGHAAPLKEGFFQYYWLTAPPHTYDLTSLPSYRQDWDGSLAIFDLDQLYWGLYRFYTDALLYFGNIRAAYQVLRTVSISQLKNFFGSQRIEPESMVARGPSLPLKEIDREDRYLIAEMACKSYAPSESDGVGLEEALRQAYRHHVKEHSEPVTVGHLLDKETGSYVMRYHKDRQRMFEFSADEILNQKIKSLSELRSKLQPIKDRFEQAREKAVANTRLYLSSVGDLDVYVATSMRNRQDFYSMADFCEEVFTDRRLRRYDLRYFDPTLSAADNHEDKGLIECLMVNCAKALIYTAGDIESFGKDAEAAMALSLGKPVIFACSSEDREKFYKEVHPLSRLINVRTGVAVGAIVTDSTPEVIELLERLFTNSMQYTLEKKRPEYLVLKEALTGSVVRLQTADKLLRETFWNHYQLTREHKDFPESP